MQIKEIENVFIESTNGIPTIVLGSGQVIIHAGVAQDPNSIVSGVIFSPSDTPYEIGEDIYVNERKSELEVGAFMRIMSTNPRSLDVLIGKLQEARDLMLQRMMREKYLEE